MFLFPSKINCVIVEDKLIAIFLAYLRLLLEMSVEVKRTW
jgi:hypothetical protein